MNIHQALIFVKVIYILILFCKSQKATIILEYNAKKYFTSNIYLSSSVAVAVVLI